MLFRASLTALAAAALLAACGESSMVAVAPGSLPTTPTVPTAPAETPPPLAAPAKSCTDANTVMAERLALLGPAEARSVIVTFEGKTAPKLSQLQLLQSLGLTVGYFQRLPIASVVATKAQIELIQKLPGVRSVRFNDRLSYEDEIARTLTSVDAVKTSTVLVNREGQPITGKGISILVNDSGIDGTHPDLEFRVKVLENAQGQTNAQAQADGSDRQMFPFAPTEGVPNTDVGGSHGTHVAGIAAGDGTASNGRFAGAAINSTLIGYGSGAVILVLDTLGGFDYALKMLDEHPEYNLRIVTNSFGNTGDVDTCFDPDDPTNVTTKILADRNLIVVFSAGNAGSGAATITGNFKKAPWVLIAGNGEKSGLLAPSSSRGRISGGVYEVEVDGERMIVEDRPTVVTPGTDYIAARATAADPFTPLDTQSDIESGRIPADQLRFYTQKTGTSMAAPHLAGLVALVLEANPALTWREVKPLFQKTATNMPGYAQHETGAGFANAEAAVAMALDLRRDYGAANRLLRPFFANTGFAGVKADTYDLVFAPTGPLHTRQTFEVGDDVALVVGKYSVPDAPVCTCAVRLTDPAGNRYGSSIALPVLGANVAATAPGMPGTWTIEMRGIGSLSGVSTDPTGQSNGAAAPSTATVTVEQFLAGEPTGLGDTVGHPFERQIEFAVSRRLVDGPGSQFRPDEAINREHLADYLMSWGIRQTRNHGPGFSFADATGAGVLSLSADVTTRRGRVLMDLNTDAAPVMLVDGANFSPRTTVTREEVAYALVQATGREAAAKALDPNAAITVTDSDGNSVPVVDAGEITPALRGHVALGVQLGIVDAVITEAAGRKTARINPKGSVTRGEYSGFAARTFASVDFP